jgi:membrane-associated phospholipid phosphatase
VIARAVALPLLLCSAVSATVGAQQLDPSPLSSATHIGEPVDGSARSGDSIFNSAVEQPEPHPQPEHTGFRALLFETAADFKAFPRRESTWVILAVGGATAALAHPLDDDANARLVGSTAVKRIFAPGKYIGSVPVQAGVAAGLYLIGRYVAAPARAGDRTNKLSHLGFDLGRALIISQALTQAIKVTVRRDRPTGDCCAFPSGHASASFATASVLERHLGYRAAWPTLLVAGYVGASRLHDNRHFLSDVLFGSALGMATGWTVVGRHGKSEYAVMPVPVRGGVMLAFVRSPR